MIWWLPTDSDEVAHVALPPEIVWAPQPEIVAPLSWNATVPVGLAPLTVAVNVTDCPAPEGFC